MCDDIKPDSIEYAECYVIRNGRELCEVDLKGTTKVLCAFATEEYARAFYSGMQFSRNHYQVNKTKEGE